MRIAELLVMTTRTTAELTTTRSHLLVDHQWFEMKLDELHAACRANDRAQMQETWNELDARLGAHLDTEERHMIPALLRWRERDARAILEEHGHIRRRMTEIGQAVDLHLVRLETIRSFIDDLRAHAQLEDQLLYQWADRQLSEPVKRSVLSMLALAAKNRRRPSEAHHP